MTASLHLPGKKVVLLGAGGHAKVLLDTLYQQNVSVDAIVDPCLYSKVDYWKGVSILGDDDYLLNQYPDDYVLVNAVGSLPGSDLRYRLFHKFTSAGFRFLSVVHPSAIIATGVTLSEDTQVMAGVVIQPDTQIGHNVILNSGCRIDHDCRIDSHVHIAPSATLCGGVMVEENVHIGAGAVVIQGIRIGRGSIIGAGSVVVKDVADFSVVIQRRY